MNALRKIADFLLTRFTKIQLGIIVALLVACFIISDSSIFARFGYDLEISHLKGQIEYYKAKSEDDRRKLKELQSDRDNLEKFARENYLMKKENEEVFVVE